MPYRWAAATSFGEPSRCPVAFISRLRLTHVSRSRTCVVNWTHELLPCCPVCSIKVRPGSYVSRPCSDAVGLQIKDLGATVDRYDRDVGVVIDQNLRLRRMLRERRLANGFQRTLCPVF